MTPLDVLAERHGIDVSFHGLDGDTPVPEETKKRILSSFGLRVATDGDIAAELAATSARAAPVLHAPAARRCFLPTWLEDGRAWGIFLQLYELRSHRNWGIGDFVDLGDLCGIAAEAGADFVGVNPLHALFLADPTRRSPFSPSNRRFLNPLYIAVDRSPGFRLDDAETEVLERLRETPLVDYEGVAAAKLAALGRVFRRWRDGDPADGRFSHAAFAAFRETGGESLRRHALFEALSERMVAGGHGSGWRQWPEQYRDAGGTAVAAFAAAHADAVAFHCWLQWIAREQLADAAETARRAGLRIGLYLDLAVGEAPDGSATWSDPHLVIADMTIGAPPDFFTAKGQNWGLTPLSPFALKETGFAPYRDTIDAAMRAAGALRIDHVMALWQLFFVPQGKEPAEGAYVRYPIAEILAVLAEESERYRTIVIGEDLGNVPEGFRPVMQAAGILSYRILYFEQLAEAFIPAGNYPQLALACLSTHDLPTLSGWWRGDDIDLRLEHGLIDAEAAGAQQADRAVKRHALVRALEAGGVLDAVDVAAANAAAREAGADFPPALAVAAHRFIARTPSVLAGVRLADLVGETAPTNLPGTIDSYPNWRPRLSVPLEEIPDLRLFTDITGAVATERPKPR